MATETPAEDFSKRMRDARSISGLSLDRLVQRANDAAGIPVVTRSMLNNYENGRTREEKADTWALVAVAAAVDMPLEELSPLHARRRDSFATLLESHNRCWGTALEDPALCGAAA